MTERGMGLCITVKENNVLKHRVYLLLQNFFFRKLANNVFEMELVMKIPTSQISRKKANYKYCIYKGEKDKYVWEHYITNNTSGVGCDRKIIIQGKWKNLGKDYQIKLKNVNCCVMFLIYLYFECKFLAIVIQSIKITCDLKLLLLLLINGINSKFYIPIRN